MRIFRSDDGAELREEDVQWCAERALDDSEAATTHAGRYIPSEQEIQAALRGHDLCCWCHLDQPCHADVLLEVANS
jgi:hypothetical protein